MDSKSDEELIAAYWDGEEKAFEILVARYIKPIYGFVFRYIGNAGDAEDITQDVFLSVWKNNKKFDATKKFKTWLFTIAKNASLNWLKKRKPTSLSEFSVEREQDIEESLEDMEPLPEALFARKELRTELERTLATLNPTNRTTLILYYTEELTFQEIADIERESLNTIKSRHLRALKALRKLLSI